MKLSKANSRDKKNRKARYGHKVSGRSVFLTQAILIKKAEQQSKESK